MRRELQQQLFADAPLLFRQAASASGWKIDVPDDLFPFLRELVAGIERFNRRYSKRRVQVLKVAVREGVLEFVLTRQIPCLEKRIVSARQNIRLYRNELRDEFLERARRMQSTALFGSRLLPEWRRRMSDERATLAKILKYAERCAVSPDDWRQLAGWYRLLLHDADEAKRCENHMDMNVCEK